ncbi:MAG: hypothetical protein WCC25_10990, partial [Candidatus Korobacteraceae bacterium]
DLSQAPLSSSREGQDLDFEPARQAHFALSGERLHEGSSAETLINVLLLAHEQALDPMALPLEEADRGLLAAILMEEHEELTPELLESAIRSLRRRRGQRELEQLQRRVKELEAKEDVMSRAQLAQEKLRLRQAMRSLQESQA